MEEEVVLILMDRDILLGIKVVLHRDVSVEVIFVKVQEDSDVWRKLQIRQLVTAEFVYDDRILIKLAEVIEDREADITYEQCVSPLLQSLRTW